MRKVIERILLMKKLNKNYNIKDSVVKKIFDVYKKDIKEFTATLNIENNYKCKVYEAWEENSNPDFWLPPFRPAIGYYRGTFDLIINQAAWRLKQDLEFENSPPITPKNQQIFRVFLITYLTGLLNDAIRLVEPLMKEIKLNPIAIEHKEEVYKDFSTILYSHINQVDTILTKIFNEYNLNIRPFRDSKRATLALSISVVSAFLTVCGVLLTIFINFRNEIWNFFKSF